MNREEAKEILDDIVREYKKKSYEELAKMIDGDVGTFTVGSKSGTNYQVEKGIFPDRKNEKNIRFDAVISCGMVSSLFPMRECFIKNPKNEFVTEGYENPLF